MVPEQCVGNASPASDFLDPLTPVAIQDYLLQIERDIFSISGSIYSEIAPRFWRYRLLKSELSLNRASLQTLVFAERSAIEIGENASRSWDSNLNEFKRHRGESFVTLTQDLSEPIYWRSGRNRQYAEAANRSYSQYLELRSTAAMFRLQRRVLWVTVLAAIAAILSLLANGEAIEKLWKASGLPR